VAESAPPYKGAYVTSPKKKAANMSAIKKVEELHNHRSTMEIINEDSNGSSLLEEFSIFS
jgi:hypothetical protein